MSYIRNYSKRQVINVEDFETIDFDERILICVPRFAWTVARSYLSVQGAWLSSYAVEHFDGGYDMPTQGQKDIIDANLADFLGESDMSCDLEAALLEIVDQLTALVQKDCSIQLACSTGSGGAGGNAEPPNGYQDVGDEPPNGFDTYGEYETFKCKMATLFIQEILSDLEYVLTLQIIEITATVLAATLISPIPGDEIVVLVGAMLIVAAAGILSSLLSEIIDGLEEDLASLVCDLFLSTDVSGAQGVMYSWARDTLSGSAQMLFGWWLGVNSLNRLFQFTNVILGGGACGECEWPAARLKDTFTDDDDVTLQVHTPEDGGPWLASVGSWIISGNEAKADGTTESRIMMDSSVADGTVSGTLKPGSGSKKGAFQGLISRGSDNANYILAGWHGGGTSKYYIAKYVASVRTELVSVDAEENYDPRLLELVADGSSLELFVNGIPVCDVTETFNLTETRWGIRAGEAGLARWDNFLMIPIV